MFISVIAQTISYTHDPFRKKYIFGVNTVIIIMYSCIKARIRLIFAGNIMLQINFKSLKVYKHQLCPAEIVLILNAKEDSSRGTTVLDPPVRLS